MNTYYNVSFYSSTEGNVSTVVKMLRRNNNTSNLTSVTLDGLNPSTRYIIQTIVTLSSNPMTHSDGSNSAEGVTGKVFFLTCFLHIII